MNIETKRVEWGDRVIAKPECDDKSYEGTVVGFLYAGSWDTNIAMVKTDELGTMPFEFRFLTKVEESSE